MGMGVRSGVRSMIRLENVSKQFGDTVAVNNLTLEIKKGECFAFLGPNGAGKTTTIKLITGLIKPTSGKIYVAGYDLEKDHLMAKRYISYIPDVPYLYDKLTGYEFLEFTGRLFGMPQGEIKKGISNLVELFDIAVYQHQLIQDYSHGTRQRLVICAALIHSPQIIVVDEPMVALDPIGTRLVKDIFKEKIKSGVTIFMSTHTLSIAEEMASRIGIIHKGKLRALGTKAQLQDITHIEGMEDVFLELIKE